MDEQHCRRTPQHTVAALGIFAPEAFEDGDITVDARHDAAQPRPDQRIHQSFFQFPEHPEGVLGNPPQHRRVGHQRIAQLPGIAGRRGAVGGRNDAVQHLLRHGTFPEGAVRPPHSQQQLDLLGRRQRGVIDRMHPLGREHLVHDRPRGANGHAMPASDAVFRLAQRHRRPGLLLLENLRRTHLHAMAAADAALPNRNIHLPPNGSPLPFRRGCVCI